MDISHFDFSAAEALDLVGRLAGLAKTIALEPRLHDDSDPTFRVSCVLAAGDGMFAAVVALEQDAGLRAVLDQGNSVRFAHAKNEEQSRV